MLHFNTQSWHYRLVLYVFGVNFFTENDTIDMAEYRKSAKIIWTRKPKVINFCPYCRGILYGTISLPFVYVWRKFPHKETKELTHEETMKRLKRRRNLTYYIAGGIQFPLALSNIFSGNYTIAIIQIMIGVVLVVMFTLLAQKYGKITKILEPLLKYFDPLIKPVINYISKYLQKKEKKETHKPKNPSIFAAYLQTKHHAICPPVYFIEKIDQEKLQ